MQKTSWEVKILRMRCCIGIWLWTRRIFQSFGMLLTTIYIIFTDGRNWKVFGKKDGGWNSCSCTFMLRHQKRSNSYLIPWYWEHYAKHRLKDAHIRASNNAIILCWKNFKSTLWASRHFVNFNSSESSISSSSTTSLPRNYLHTFSPWFKLNQVIKISCVIYRASSNKK